MKIIFKNKYYILLGVIIAIIPFLFIDTITRFPRGLMSDDSYFYAKIAYNIAINKISSFDGINITDGYHLFWCWCLTGISSITSFFTENIRIHLSMMISFYLTICFAIAYFIGNNLKERISYFFLGIIFKIMMETTLLAFLLLLFIDKFYIGEKKRSKYFLIPILFIPLIRIDACIFIGILSLYYLLKKEFKTFFCINTILGVGVILHIFAMKLIFGHISTVSSKIKAVSMFNVFSNIQNNLSGIYSVNFILLIICFSFFTLAIINIIYSTNKEKLKGFSIIIAGITFIIIHNLTNNNVRYWYYIPTIYLLSYVIFKYSHKIKVIKFLNNFAFSGLIFVFILKFYIDTNSRKDSNEYSKKFVTQIKSIVEPNEPIFQVDGSGFVGYFSDRHLINGDGLVNTHKYLSFMRENKIDDYIKQNQIKYIITNNYTNETIINNKGLILNKNNVIPLILPNKGLPKMTAFGLFKIKEDWLINE